MRFVLISAIIMILIETSVCRIYKISTSAITPSVSNGNVVFINKLAFGLHIPFMNSTIVNWASPQKDDIILFYTIDQEEKSQTSQTPQKPQKSQKTKILLRRVIGVSNDIVMIQNRRYLVPNGYVFVMLDDPQQPHDPNNLRFVPIENILGDCLFQ